jgi:MoaA/NifB/PqqE/SkfB family radical SAM enzyme
VTYISPSKALSHIDRLAKWHAGGKPAPVTIEWDLSNRCYLGCEGCHFAYTHTKGPWVLQSRVSPTGFDPTGDLADTELVKRGLSQMAEAGVKGVVWSGGGEPTTHPHWIDLVEHAVGCGLDVGMYTAGGLITPETAPRLGAAATWVVVSMDAPTATGYAKEKRSTPAMHARACATVQMLAAQPVDVGVSFLIHEGNWREMPAMRAMALELGATFAMFRPRIDTVPDAPTVNVSPTGWVTQALPLLHEMSALPNTECDALRFTKYQHFERRYTACHGIKLNATITPDGRVWLCPQHRGVSGSCIGDLRRESFVELWSRHPGAQTNFHDCRVMCRLHLVNEVVGEVFSPRAHSSFV